MTEGSIVAICSASAIIITQIVNLVVSIRNGTKADTAAIKQDAIHALVDGNLTKVSNQLAVANEKIEGLHTVIAVQSATPKEKDS